MRGITVPLRPIGAGACPQAALTHRRGVSLHVHGAGTGDAARPDQLAGSPLMYSASAWISCSLSSFLKPGMAPDFPFAMRS